VAKLYKKGVIAPAYQSLNEPDGQAIAAKEQRSDRLEFHVLYNFKLADGAFKSEHPSRWVDVKAECRAFAAQRTRTHVSPY
jgi:hypothetical protein